MHNEPIEQISGQNEHQIGGIGEIYQQQNNFDEGQIDMSGAAARNQTPVQIISDIEGGSDTQSRQRLQPPQNDQNAFKDAQLMQQEQESDPNQNNNLATDDMMAFYEDQNIQAQHTSIISNMSQAAVLFDSQPIRAVCFSPNSSEYFVLGTNSRSLKFCKISQSILEPFGNMIGDPNKFGSQTDLHGADDQGIKVIFEQQEHHNGSIYCVDWSKTSRLVATGSNDKMIKILIAPNFEEMAAEGAGGDNQIE